MDAFSTELGIRLSFVKTSEFPGGGGVNPQTPLSVRHCCPVKQNGVWTIRTNLELRDVYREADLVSEITT
jgi:hypothetical protein